MNKTLSTILLLAIATTLSYFFSPSAKQTIEKYIFGLEEVAPPPDTPERWIYVLADGTGSAHSTYAIPKVTTSWIGQVLDEMYQSSGGRFYLSHIDRDSRNNQVLYLSVPKIIIPPSEPLRSDGEISFEYTNRLNIWKESLYQHKADSISVAEAYIKSKNQFLQECSELLSSKVYVKSEDNQWTDIIGILNASFITMSNEQRTGVEKYVVGFSDYIHDAPYLKGIKLDSVPPDVQLIAVNPIQNSSEKITTNIVEFEHPQRVIETIFKN